MRKSQGKRAQAGKQGREQSALKKDKKQTKLDWSCSAIKIALSSLSRARYHCKKNNKTHTLAYTQGKHGKARYPPAQEPNPAQQLPHWIINATKIKIRALRQRRDSSAWACTHRRDKWWNHVHVYLLRPPSRIKDNVRWRRRRRRRGSRAWKWIPHMHCCHSSLCVCVCVQAAGPWRTPSPHPLVSNTNEPWQNYCSELWSVKPRLLNGRESSGHSGNFLAKLHFVGL